MKGSCLSPHGKALKGFTMAEVLVAMVLSTLVIAFAYMIYQLTARSFKNDVKNQESVGDFILFKNYFEQDAELCEEMISDGQSLICTGEKGKISEYCFHRDTIFRKSPENQEIFNTGYRFLEIRYIAENSTLVESIKFHFQPDSILHFVFYYRKQYEEKVLFRKDQINGVSP